MSFSQWFLLILIIAAASIYFTTKEPLRLMTECYQDSDLIDDSTVHYNDRRVNTLEVLCAERKERIPEISACMREVQIDHPVASEFLRIASLVKPELRSGYATEVHNRSCIEYPDTLIE